MKQLSLSLTFSWLIFALGCTCLPEYGVADRGDNGTELPYTIEAGEPLEPGHGLRFDFTLLSQHLDILVLEGAELCFPATVVQARSRENRIAGEIAGQLLYDAANDIIIQRRLLERLERQLQYVNQHQACQLATTRELVTPGDIGKKIEILLNVDNQFATGSFSLNPKFIVRLAQAVELLTGLPDYRLLITGHADPRGKVADNIRLSQQRAEQVSRYIQIMGIAGERIDIAGVGSSEPLLAGNEAAVRLINRRVSIELIEPGPANRDRAKTVTTP